MKIPALAEHDAALGTALDAAHDAAYDVALDAAWRASGGYDVIDSLVVTGWGSAGGPGSRAVTTASAARAVRYADQRVIQPEMCPPYICARRRFSENGREMKVKSAASTVMLVGMIVVITTIVSAGLHLYCLVRRVAA